LLELGSELFFFLSPV